MIRPTDLHRMFIQSILSRRVFTECVGVEIYKRCTLAMKDHDPNFQPTHRPSTGGLLSFIGEINELLMPLGMEVKRGRREQDETGTLVWSLINKDTSSLSELATDMTTLEISYFRQVIESIVESYPANSIGASRALKIAGELTAAMPRTHAESLLKALVSRGWLDRSARGRYTLSQRSILELSPFLEATYDENSLFRCPWKTCQAIVLQGFRCEYEGCDTHIHSFCRSSLANARTDRCPRCKGDWTVAGTFPSKVGEASVPVIEDKFEKGGRRKRKSGGRPAENDEEEERDEEADEVEVEASQRARTTSRTQRS